MTAAGPALTIGEVLSGLARTRPDQTGVRDLDRTLSYAAWNERANRLGNALLGLGLVAGDRVAVFAHNRLEFAEIYAAVAKAGLVAVPINFRLSPAELSFIVQDCGARVVLAEDILCDTVEEARDSLDIPAAHFIGIGAARAGYRAYEDLLQAGAATPPDVGVAPEDPWCVMYTSGTTGHPKGAVRCHRDMGQLALMTAVEFSLGAGDHALLVMPMCHANSLNFFTAFLFAGAPVTIFSRASFDPALCMSALQSATFSSMVPTQFSMLMELPRGATAPVRKLLISSAPSFAETKRAIMERFPQSGLYELYGSTEAGWVTMLHPDAQFDHLGSVGREVIGSRPIRFLDEAGAEVSDGTPGELFSCSPYQFDGYLNLPDKTAEAMRGGFLSVGDIGYRDESGYIHLVDRKKNMIITGGENVYPSEIERVLMAHPAVRDAAVVGVADAKWGERVVAAVVLKTGAEATPDALDGWCRQQLAGFKRPRDFRLLAPADMPRNTTGKILHRRLREIFADLPKE